MIYFKNKILRSVGYEGRPLFPFEDYQEEEKSLVICSFDTLERFCGFSFNEVMLYGVDDL